MFTPVRTNTKPNSNNEAENRFTVSLINPVFSCKRIFREYESLSIKVWLPEFFEKLMKPQTRPGYSSIKFSSKYDSHDSGKGIMWKQILCVSTIISSVWWFGTATTRHRNKVRPGFYIDSSTFQLWSLQTRLQVIMMIDTSKHQVHELNNIRVCTSHRFFFTCIDHQSFYMSIEQMNANLMKRIQLKNVTWILSTYPKWWDGSSIRNFSWNTKFMNSLEPRWSSRRLYLYQFETDPWLPIFHFILWKQISCVEFQFSSFNEQLINSNLTKNDLDKLRNWTNG